MVISEEKEFIIHQLSPKLLLPAMVYTEDIGYDKLLNSTVGIIPKSKLFLNLTKYNSSYMKRYVSYLKSSTLFLHGETTDVDSSINIKFNYDTDFETLNSMKEDNKMYRLEPGKLPNEFYSLLKLMPEQIRLKGPYDIQRLCINRGTKAKFPCINLRIKDDWHYDGGLEFEGFSIIDINIGPNPLEWIVIPSKEYKALKKLIKIEPLDNIKFWNISIDQLISNNITVNIVTQDAGDVVLLSE